VAIVGDDAGGQMNSDFVGAEVDFSFGDVKKVAQFARKSFTATASAGHREKEGALRVIFKKILPPEKSF